MKASERIKIPKKDVKRSVFHCGGPGGQNSNKTETGVRFTHLPTGISSESRSERSQKQNEVDAYERLCQKLLDLYYLRLNGDKKIRHKEKPSISSGNQIRSYLLVGNHQAVVDHETGNEYNPRNILNGGLDDLLYDRLKYYMAEQWVENDA